MDMKNKNYHKITVADMAPHIHHFLPNENKTEKIYNWLKNWIDLSLECGKINYGDLLPLKADLAYHIGVSQGTIQNVFRTLENENYLESKQKIGTVIKNRKDTSVIEKLTSKRELAIEILKKYILENNYKINDKLISTRVLADATGMSISTIRFAACCLEREGILKKDKKNFIIKSLNFTINKIETQTLVEKIGISLKKYINENLKAGDKLPSNMVLSKKFNVSIKTIHDAIKILAKEGLLCIRRGQYGISVISEKKLSDMDIKYIYEKIEQKIRQYIIANCQIEDKLPSIKDFAIQLDTSEKTVKKALDNLAEEGYITFVRGRYGGTFVLDIPADSTEAYKWLAITSEYIENMEN